MFRSSSLDENEERGVELVVAGESVGVASLDESGERAFRGVLPRDPGPCLLYASAKKRMLSSNAWTSPSISYALMCGLKCARLSTARLPWVAEMTYAGFCPMSSATLPHAASTAEMESVSVPSCPASSACEGEMYGHARTHHIEEDSIGEEMSLE